MTEALGGGEWSAARPGRTLPPGKTQYPFYKRLGGPQGRCGRAENLVPTRIRSRTVQPVTQSLYRLSYPAHCIETSGSKYLRITCMSMLHYIVYLSTIQFCALLSITLPKEDIFFVIYTDVTSFILPTWLITNKAVTKLFSIPLLDFFSFCTKKKSLHTLD